MSTRIKVKVSDLISAVEAKREAARKEHAKSVADFEKANDGLAERKQAWAVQALAKALAAAETGKEPWTGSEYRYAPGGRSNYTTVIYVPVDDRIIVNVKDPGEFTSDDYDRDLTLLRMSSDDTIVVGQNNDWLRYL